MTYHINPIGFVEGVRANPEDDYWGGEHSRIAIAEDISTEALTGLESFSHVEVLFLFHEVEQEEIVTGARHPRNNKDWPKVGIFAQRGKNRPNRIGSTVCKVVGIDGRTLVVSELDAINGTPVIDIKPVMREFLPRGEVVQPQWAEELMARYWLPGKNSSDG